MNRKWVEENRLRIVGAVVVLAALAIVILVSSGDEEPQTAANGAEIVSVDELRERAALQATPVYWAGERPETELELSQQGGGQTYVRYLTGDAEVGDPRPAYLTVGTYETPDAIAVLRRQSRQADGVLAKAPGGATVYFSRNDPRSVYLAYPGVDAQVEVYDPSFERALRLVNSGRIVPVG